MPHPLAQGHVMLNRKKLALADTKACEPQAALSSPHLEKVPAALKNPGRGRAES